MKSRDPQQAVALVLVLAFLVILSGVILAFFTSVTTESSAASSYAGGASARVLADSAINLVQAQLRDATSNPPGQGSSSEIRAWASQPGMIRTFGTDGQPDKFYKLYSSDRLVIDGRGFDSDLPDPDWNTGIRQELYTDLNAPVAYHDPDPSVKPPTTDDERLDRLVFPIVHPRAERVVEGFSIDTSKRTGYDSSQPLSAANHPAPMPVKWLYLLQDGTLAPATVEAESLKVNGANADNPIIGRVAFWADDETAKININTASEGSYWDVPRVYSLEDFGKQTTSSTTLPGLAVAQPANREYQRYPGHPATTSLSAVFGNANGLPAPVLPVPAVITAANATMLTPYYDIAPRIGEKKGKPKRSSMSGTKRPVGALEVDKDRLYASIDELMFSAPTDETSGPRVPNTSTGMKPNLITRQVLERSKFFLTANSNAPETTLFNTPRVVMWPVDTSETKRTAFDTLAAFCGTIGPPASPAQRAYYFDRSNPRSNSVDYGPRNRALYAYLQKLTERNIPGFGGNFLKKYSEGKFGATERDQILTYLYDYIRSTNLQYRPEPAKSYTKLFLDNSRPEGAGEVVPIRIGRTQGFGRFHSVSEADILFYASKSVEVNKVKVASEMRAVFFLEFVTPMQGLGAIKSGMKYTVSGLEKLQVNIGPIFTDQGWQPLRFKAAGTNFMELEDLVAYHGRSVGGTEGPWHAFKGGNGSNKSLTAGSSLRGSYPFVTDGPIVIGPTAKTFRLRMGELGGKIKIEIATSDTNTVVQTLHVSFPETELKIPSSRDLTHDFGSRLGNVFNLIGTGDTVVGLEPAGRRGNSVEPGLDHTAGDSRMIAGLEDVPTGHFRAHNDYLKGGPGGSGETRELAHGLVASIGLGRPKNNPNDVYPEGLYLGGTYGKLVNVPASGNPPRPYGQPPGNARQPDVPSRVGNYVARSDGMPGDWDTGFGDQKDGAYINKPDEGDTELAEQAGSEARIPYLLGYGKGFMAGRGDYFSPNRQIPSPLMFGSIPTGVQRFEPWQTLLFHARPEDLDHPGRATPPDHLLADLFWMPVVEPYAISQPFATAGKINMNYQIQPFTYIRRDTGVRAVMKATKFLAIPVSASSTYKPLDPGNEGTRTPNLRKAIDLPTAPGVVPETLKAFDLRFNDRAIGLFRSATQICEMNLIPAGYKDSTMAEFWKANPLTGDNVREKPYVDIYPRLTTKSNVFNVHVRVQALKKAVNTPPDQWVAGKDLVLSEYRGSSIIERYIDPNDPRLPDFARAFASDPSDPQLNIDQYYRMRVVSTKTFTP